MAARNPEGYPAVVAKSGSLRRAVYHAYNIYFSIQAAEVRIERVVNSALDATPGHLDR